MFNPDGSINHVFLLSLYSYYQVLPEWDARCRIIVELARKWGAKPAAVKLLVKALNDKDAFVRANAVRELGRLGIKDAAAEIGKLESDPSPFVRDAAAKALEKPGE